MDWMGLKEEHKLLRQDMKRFAETELEPEVGEMDKESKPFIKLMKKLGEIGGLGMLIPEEFGGADMDTLSLVLTIEELAKVSPSFALSVATHNFAGDVIMNNGSLDLKKRYLPSLSTGKMVCGIAMDTMIHPTEDNGEDERFIVNGSFSDIFGISVEKDKKREFVIVEDNMHLIEEKEMMGMRSSGICSFNPKKDEVDRRRSLTVSEPDKFDAKMRLFWAGIACGISQSTFKYALSYSKEREQFGRTIASFGMVRMMLAEIASKVNATRALVYQASLNDDIIGSEVAGLFAVENCLFVTDKGVQIYGGYGYTKDYPIEMFFRDAKVLELFAGSVDYRKMKIGKLLTS